MEDVVKIRELVNAYKEAVHSQNEDDFRNLWVDSDDVTMISITHRFTGIDCIYHDFLIDRIQKAYQDIILIEDSEPVIHFIDNNNAIVIFEYHTECIRRNSLETYGIKGLETQVVKKVNGEWKLMHVHYSK